MNDCLNAEMRDLLPELLHDRLAADVRAVVTAHVSDCVDCREELELLRRLQTALLASTPRVDVAYVVGALPKPPAQIRPLARSSSRRTWSDWRIAAAVTLLVAGGSSVALINRGGPQQTIIDTTMVAERPVTPAQPVNSATRANVAPSSPAETVVATAPRTGTEGANGLGMGGHLADLNDDQLKALVDEIQQMKAVPITEPEPVTMRVDPRGSSQEDR